LRTANRNRLDLAKIHSIANKAEKDAGYTRQFYSYPAKFQHRLPRYLIEHLTSEGDLVVDPYVGGGTTALEAVLLNRRFVGYDLNPFAVLISRVKTTKLAAHTLRDLLTDILARAKSTTDPKTYFDQLDIECLGQQNATAAASLANAIKTVRDRRHREFFMLALIHSLKILGRRDYDEAANHNGKGDGNKPDLALSLFDAIEEDQIAVMFAKKARRMIHELQALPARHPTVEIINRSNHDMREVTDNEASIIVTSPPYKDVDVEYALLQFQRPSLNRSKRSSVLERLLDLDHPPAKNTLCGEKGDNYWTNIAPTFREARRILKPGGFAFWWTGFKTKDDHDRFIEELNTARFQLVDDMAVTLGNDRVASSRSTHHERDTGMLAKDYLIITRRNGSKP
jgi:DNA modification methylase